MDKSERGQVGVSKDRKLVRRRRYSREQKLAIIRECLEPGASLAGVALAHQANANMVRKWVVKFQRGGFGPAAGNGTALLPVVVGPRPAAKATVKATASNPTLEIEMPRGRVRIYGALDAELLSSLMTALAGR